MHIRFKTPHQYFFIHEQIKHLLVLWSKDQHRELYIVEEAEDAVILHYPGETYRDILLDRLEHVFFQRLETDDDNFRVALAATFEFEGRLMGAYYKIGEESQHHPIEQLYFYELGDDMLYEIDDHEYEAVAKTFYETFPEYLVER